MSEFTPVALLILPIGSAAMAKVRSIFKNERPYNKQ